MFAVVVVTPLLYYRTFLAKWLWGKIDTIHRLCLLSVVVVVVVVVVGVVVVVIIPLVCYKDFLAKVALG